MSDIVDNYGAVILCGGRSRRMGRDKAWIELDRGRPMILEVTRRIAQVVTPEHIVVAARREQSLPDLTSAIRVVRDNIDDQGPLAGIVVGLTSLAAEVEFALVAACDSPRFEPRLVELLRQQIQSANAAVPRVEDQMFPLTALYRIAPALAIARELFAAGERRAIEWARQCEPRTIEEAMLRTVDPNLASFAPCNTPEELERARGESESRSE